MRLSFFLAALVLLLKSPAMGSDPSASPAKTELHILIDVQENVTFKRPGWKIYNRATLGTVLQRGDLLYTPRAGDAVVVCADLAIHKIAGPFSAVPCGSAPPLLVMGSSLLNPMRSGQISETPILVSPRATKLLSHYPSFHWISLPSISRVRVRLQGPNIDWVREVPASQRLTYPDSEPPLVSGSIYRVTIFEPETKRSSEADTSSQTFRVMDSAEAAEVVATGKKIRSLPISPFGRSLLEANLYAGNDLNAEAIEILERLSVGTREPVIFRSLGDLYLRIGVVRLAQERYRKAVEFSRRKRDIEGQAIACDMLARIAYFVSGDTNAAIGYLRKSAKFYRQLGERERLQKVEALSVRIRKP